MIRRPARGCNVVTRDQVTGPSQLNLQELTFFTYLSDGMELTLRNTAPEQLLPYSSRCYLINRA